MVQPSCQLLKRINAFDRRCDGFDTLTGRENDRIHQARGHVASKFQGFLIPVERNFFYRWNYDRRTAQILDQFGNLEGAPALERQHRKADERSRGVNSY